MARLEKQANFTFASLDLKRGQRVLDLATGVGAMGAMGARLVRSWPGIDLVGVDLAEGQLAAARENHPELRILRGNASRLLSQTRPSIACTAAGCSSTCPPRSPW
jgi:ubiquinone/menaquinone biosynthesis C-methylase UbiE